MSRDSVSSEPLGNHPPVRPWILRNSSMTIARPGMNNCPTETEVRQYSEFNKLAGKDNHVDDLARAKQDLHRRGRKRMLRDARMHVMIVGSGTVALPMPIIASAWSNGSSDTPATP